MSDETAKLIDKEIRGLVEQGYARAQEILKGHEDQLHLLANAMLEYETLSGEEIKTLLDKGEITRDDGTTIKPSTIPAVGSRSEEHTSELQSLMRISYAVFCLKKKKHKKS